jgi:hypothetical protein
MKSLVSSRFDPAATALLDGLDHPLRAEIDAVRSLILSADSTISEGVKWNSASFRTVEWFATVHWRNREAVQIVLHLGAKMKGKTVAVDDPEGLLNWLAKDRAMLTFPCGPLKAKTGRVVAKLIREWIGHIH